MLIYHLQLALRELRRHRWLAALITLQLAVGVAAFVVTTQLKAAMARDPLPGKSGQTWRLQVDPRPSRFAVDGMEPPQALTAGDAQRLAVLFPGTRQTRAVGGQMRIEAAINTLPPFHVDAVATSSAFFAMFDVPLSEGGGWTPDADARGEKVAVIAMSLARHLFGRASALGQTLVTQAGEFRVVGVEADWNPIPRFYDLTRRNMHGAADQIFVPFSSIPHIDNGAWGTVDCWEANVDFEHLDNQPCQWIPYWLQSPDLTQQEVVSRLTAYSNVERSNGHYQLRPNVRARTVLQWLAFNQAVPREVALEEYLAWIFLAVCMTNTMALLVTKFSRMRGTLALRRALGASRARIASQLFVEACAYGALGGLSGALLSLPLARIIRYQDTGYSAVSLSVIPLLAGTVVVAFATVTVASAAPVWLGIRPSIHEQMKARQA